MKPSPYAFAWFSGLASQRWMCPSTMKYFVPSFSYMEPPRASVGPRPSGLTSQWHGSEGGSRKDAREGRFPPAPAGKRSFGQPGQLPYAADQVLPATHRGDLHSLGSLGGNPIPPWESLLGRGRDAGKPSLRPRAERAAVL